MHQLAARLALCALAFTLGACAAAPTAPTDPSSSEARPRFDSPISTAGCNHHTLPWFC